MRVTVLRYDEVRYVDRSVWVGETQKFLFMVSVYEIFYYFLWSFSCYAGSDKVFEYINGFCVNANGELGLNDWDGYGPRECGDARGKNINLFAVGATYDGADLRGANLAEFYHPFGWVSFVGAKINSKTVLPFDIKTAFKKYKMHYIYDNGEIARSYEEYVGTRLKISGNSCTIVFPKNKYFQPEKDLSFKDISGNSHFYYMGSAARIGAREFFTAKHVFEIAQQISGIDDPVAWIQCPNLEFSKVAHWKRQPGNDIAIFTTQEVFSGTPFYLPTTHKERQHLLKHADCFKEGNGPGEFGLLELSPFTRVYALEQENLTAETRVPVESPHFSAGALIHGDSGGPAYCLDDQKRKVLVGVTHGGQIRSSLFRSAFTVHVGLTEKVLKWARPLLYED